MVQVLGMPDKKGSFERGRRMKLLKEQKPFIGKTACWRIESTIANDKPVDLHLKSLYRRTAKNIARARQEFGDRIRIAVNIGIFFGLSTTVRGMIKVSAFRLKDFVDIVDAVEISAYPYSE